MKFSQIIREELDIRGIRKVLNTIQKYFIGKLEKKPDNLFSFDGYIDKVEDFYIPLFDFIGETITSEHSELMDIFNTFIVEYNPEGNYENVGGIVKLTEGNLKTIFDYEVIVLTNYFRTSPYLIGKVGTRYYSLPIYYIHEEENFYCIGDYQDMIYANKEYLRDRYYDQQEIINSIGGEEYINYLFIEDYDKDRLSNEMSIDRESEMSDEEILGYLKRFSKPHIVDLVNSYENSSEEERGKIIEELRKYSIEFLYNQYYDELDNIFEYLLERGFIDITDDGRQVEINKIPNFIKFDWDNFIDDESGDLHFEQLSDYGQVYRYGGDKPYYMIKIDY
jgi:hypothetical protein